MRDLGPEIQEGAVLACEACAGTLFRLVKQAGAYQLRAVPQVSCPRCEAVMQLADTVEPGDTLQHCNHPFVVTYAYGAYALEASGTYDNGAAS